MQPSFLPKMYRLTGHSCHQACNTLHGRFRNGQPAANRAESNPGLRRLHSKNPVLISPGHGLFNPSSRLALLALVCLGCTTLSTVTQDLTGTHARICYTCSPGSPIGPLYCFVPQLRNSLNYVSTEIPDLTPGFGIRTRTTKTIYSHI